MAFLIVFVVLFWVIPVVVCKDQAEKKGKPTGGWIALGICLGWIGALIAVLAPAATSEQRATVGLASGTHRRCPFCAEAIQRAAIVCKHCGRDLPRATATDAAAVTEPRPWAIHPDVLIEDARVLLKAKVPMGDAADRLAKAAGGDREVLIAAAMRVAKDTNRSFVAGDKRKVYRLLNAAASKR